MISPPLLATSPTTGWPTVARKATPPLALESEDPPPSTQRGISTAPSARTTPAVASRARNQNHDLSLHRTPPQGQENPSVLMVVPRVTSTQVTVPATPLPTSRELLMVTAPPSSATEFVAPSNTLWVTLDGP